MNHLPACFARLGLVPHNPGTWIGETPFPHPDGVNHARLSPIDDTPLPAVATSGPEGYKAAANAVENAFREWQLVPAPRRAGLARALAGLFREASGALSELIAREIGKPVPEAAAEVEAAASYCEFAAGTAERLIGQDIPSAFAGRRCFERWHPLGPTALISVFNFPVLVWAWNALPAAVCGNSVLWKPSPKALLTALAVQQLAARAARQNGAPDGLFCLVSDTDGALGSQMAHDPRFPLVSFTGGTAVGRTVGQTVAGRFGRCLLELGGMNAAIITPHADLALAVRECTTSATITSGQRCTSLRRLYVAESVFEETKRLLVDGWAGLRLGNPLDPAGPLGPLIDRDAVARHHAVLAAARERGARILCGGERPEADAGCHVQPALVETTAAALCGIEEYFSPILFVAAYPGALAEAIRLQNDSPYGLASAVFTQDLAEAETFLSAAGSDCGMANVNLGTAGAEIRIAFGGEKASGGGRVSGSDTWKNFMRRMSGAIACG